MVLRRCEGSAFTSDGPYRELTLSWVTRSVTGLNCVPCTLLTFPVLELSLKNVLAVRQATNNELEMSENKPLELRLLHASTLLWHTARS